ncbi:MAG: DUF1800 family protein [Bacteroidetes bacterium]|nr:DUF1800 family protein [Bacteroidota bacterium]
MLKIGSNLSLPVDAVTQTFGFIGRKRSGKTYATGKLVEELSKAKAQVIVLDPVGVWYGLRLDRTGKGPGLAIPVLGGEHGDIPLESGGGRLIADLVVDKTLSVVLDISLFSKAKRKDFVADFAEHLFHRKKKSRTPLHVVFEEAQMFAPQMKAGKDIGMARMLGAVEDIVRIGGNYGIGSTLISQRPQSVNKEVLNQVEAPNENYGRELLELFTMGLRDEQGNDNYTEIDIEQIARALTGWYIDWHNLSVLFMTEYYDDGEKTFFGRTGNFGYDDVIDIIFEERASQIARFICRKLYREFVYAAPDEAIVAELADIFLANNFEIAPVVRTLLKSAHFFDTQTVGAHVKSPVEEMLGFTLETDTTPGGDLFLAMFWLSGELGQYVLEPPNVAGWPGHRDWLNTSTLVNRWDFTSYLLFGDEGHEEEEGFPAPDVRALAKELQDPDDPLAVFRLPTALVEHLMPIMAEELDIEPITDGFGGDLVNNPIPDAIANGPAHVRERGKGGMQGIPWYEWDLDHPYSPCVILVFLYYVIQLPEFQLS